MQAYLTHVPFTHFCQTSTVNLMWRSRTFRGRGCPRAGAAMDVKKY